MILVLVLFSLAGSQARPQDVEFVTSLETLQDETITDNPILQLELGDTKGKQTYKLHLLLLLLWVTLSLNLN